MKVNVYAKKQSDIDLIKLERDYKDEDGNSWLVYSGVDQNGLRCEIKLEIFRNTTDNEHIASLFLVYSDVEIVYRLRRD